MTTDTNAITDKGIQVREKISERDKGIVSQLRVEPTGEGAIAGRLAIPLPHGVDANQVQIDPDNSPAKSLVDDSHLLLEVWVDGDTTETIRYAFQTNQNLGEITGGPLIIRSTGVDDDVIAAGSGGGSPFSLPLAEESPSEDPGIESQAATDSSLDLGDELSGDGGSETTASQESTTDRAGPTLGPDVESLEADQKEPDDPVPRGDNDAAPRGQYPQDPDVPPTGNNRGPDATPLGQDSVNGQSVIEQFVAELQERDLTEHEQEAIRSALDMESPTHLELKVNDLQSQVMDIQAYMDGLEAFIDEYGADEDVIDDFEKKFAELTNDIERLDESIDDVAETANQTTELNDDLTSLEASVNEQFESVTTQLSTLDDELSELERTVAELESVHSEDVSDLQASIEELQSLQDKLSTAFSSMSPETE